MLETPAMAPAPRPERLGSYELLLELASGGMATVYLGRAVDKRQGPPLVAVKRPHRHLSGDKTFLTMLVDEARLASAIDHPNVVKVRELGFEGGMPFIVMDYVEGTSLAELRRELSANGRALDVRVAVRVVVDALAGLQAAHELKDDNGKPLHIIHRDVSPHNVLVGCDGRSYLTDFGIAKAEDRIQTTRTHEVKGKLAYLAPERIDKRRMCTIQSDIFSMAVVLWECFAGRRLFRGEEAVDILQEVLSAHIPTLKQIGAQIPSALDDVIARALSRDLETRYATASEFSDAIQRAVGPEMLGGAPDVARLMELVFGPRMGQRQEHVRATIGATVLTDLLRESGLQARENSLIAEAPPPQALADLAPPAPTGRYALGTPLEPGTRRRFPWVGAAAVAGGIAVGVALTLAVTSHLSKPPPIVVRGTVTAATAPLLPPPPLTRHVVLPLPFLATRVIFDNEARELDPATDTATFDVPGDADERHSVTAFALDGTRADGYVREQDGIARPDGAPLTLVSPAASESRTGARVTAPTGAVHNGFTKLR